ncbi:hypothetical protein [Acinetobacter sp.]|uniref:hypothetical protein n=1 Tax=Acinetobacter sp. TaxID=472 RepID=UPI00388EA075
MNLYFRQRTTIALLTSALLSTGCATVLLYADYKPKSYNSTVQIIIEDEIIAMGEAVKHGHSENKENKKIVFIGRQYTYLIDNAEEFRSIVKEIPAEKLQITHPTLQFELQNENEFQGFISLGYVDALEDIPAHQLQRLKDLEFKLPGFTPAHQKQYLTYNVMFKGTVHEPLPEQAIQHRFSKPYPFKMVKNNKTTTINTGNILKTRLLTPLAVSFDVITSPIWGGLLLICSLNSKSCKPNFQ